MIYEQIKKDLETRTHVSFDIFDTLVLRPYVKPTDLFYHLEDQENKPGFASARIRAEKEARVKYHREITLDEIYAQLDISMQTFKNLECEYEISVAVPNREIIQIINQIPKNKHILLISDMYLPSDVIIQVLNKCGITGYDKLYVSSEYGVTKHSGELYQKVLAELHIKPQDLFHVGDNLHADYWMALRKGIAAYHYFSPMKRYLDTHPPQQRFYKQTKDWQRSIIVAMDMIYLSTLSSLNKISWYNLGYRFGGPLVYGYAKHLEDTISEGSIVLFAARDGYNIMKVLQEISIKQIDYNYIYAQRILYAVFSEEYINYGKIRMPNRHKEYLDYSKTLSNIRYLLEYYLDELPSGWKDLSAANDEQIIGLYNDASKVIDHFRKRDLDEYRKTISAICTSDRKIELVDCTTMKFSSQKLLEYVLERKIYGHYFVTLSDEKDITHESFHRRKGLEIDWTMVNIPEFFMCSPEYPVIGIKQNVPIYKIDNPDCEITRKNIYPLISESECDYARDLVQIFGEKLPHFDCDTLLSWCKVLLRDKESAEREALSMIKWASDPAHGEYRNIIPTVKDIPHWIKKMILDIIWKIN